jgi:hypothetical protein
MVPAVVSVDIPYAESVLPKHWLARVESVLIKAELAHAAAE